MAIGSQEFSILKSLGFLCYENIGNWRFKERGNEFILPARDDTSFQISMVVDDDDNRAFIYQVASVDLI
jgi:hypothetical protein